MSIITQLSSQVGDRTEVSNLKVVAACQADPTLLAEIVSGLSSKDAALVGDCAEVLTKVAETDPAWVSPYAPQLITLLTHKNTRIRWEAAHALAFVAALAAPVIASSLPQLREIVHHDKSVIVRDYTVDTIANYAAVNVQATELAYPILVEALTTWEGKQAGHALAGLTNVAKTTPHFHDELRHYAQLCLADSRNVVRQAAKKLLKAIG
jgi:HEAT repeat protein